MSVLAHVALLAAIAWWLDDDERDDDERDDGGREREERRGGEHDAIPIEISTRMPARELEVAVLEGEPADPAAASAAAAAAASAVASAGSEQVHGRGAMAGASAGATAGTASGGGGDGEELGRRNPLAMRGLRHDLSISDDALSKLLKDRPLPDPVEPSGHIQQNGREGRIVDPVASYVVHGDGTVDIHSKKDIDIRWKIPLPTPSRILRGARELGDDLAAWKEDPYRDTRVGTFQDLPRHLQAVPGACGTFDDPMCDAESPQKTVGKSMSGDGTVIPVLGGRFDITSYLHRKLIGDPFSSRKLKMLNATRAERVESGAVYRAARLGQSAELMARNLEALWGSTTDPAARREALFELWDECAEGEGVAGAAGERARAMVIGWIGTHLPRGQPGAFSADEIARLDARRASKQHFAPY